MTEEQLQAIRTQYGLTDDIINKTSSIQNNVSINQTETPEQRKSYLQGLVAKKESEKKGDGKIMSFIKKASDFVGTTKLGEGIGTAYATMTEDEEYQQEYNKRQDDLNKLIQDQYKEATEKGDQETIDRLLKLSQKQGQDENVMEAMTEDAPTTGQIAGSALRTASNFIMTDAFSKNIVQMAKINAAEGAVSGALSGMGMALEEAKETEDIIKSGIKYGAIGAASGFGFTYAAGLLGKGFRKFAQTSNVTGDVGRLATIKTPISGVIDDISKLGAIKTPIDTGDIARIGVTKTAPKIGDTVNPYINPVYSFLDDLGAKKSQRIINEATEQAGNKIKLTIDDEISDLIKQELINPKINNKPKIISLINEGAEVQDLLTNKIDNTNPFVKKASTLGYTEADINIIARGTAEEQLLKKEIFSNSLLQKKNPSSTRIAEIVPARETIKMTDFLTDESKKLSQIVSKNLDDMPDSLYNFTDSYTNFSNQLNKINIVELPDGKLDFSKSVLKSDTSGQKLINGLYEDFIENGGKFTPKQVDIIRKRISSETNLFGKKFDLSDEANKILYTARKDLMDGLNDISPDYRLNNTRLSIIIQASDDFQTKFLGPDFQFTKASTKQEKVGQVARRMQGNASAIYNNIFDNLQGTAEYFGYDTNGVNIRRLFNFADLANLENKVVQKTSLAGQIGTAKNIATTGADILRAGRGITGKIDLVSKQIQKLGGDYDIKRQAALIELLDNYSLTPKIKIDLPTVKIEQVKK
ncbi:MAG: hypothetical protein EOL88_10170 [Bacteroidia bacterium]|nr:hypothetical protein [Bacteroidia bacterium]